MNWQSTEQTRCEPFRQQFSAYLDGELNGVAMQAMVGHLQGCAGCEAEFAGWREMQDALASMGSAQAPDGLQSRLRMAMASERERRSHLAWHERALELWRATWAPVAMRVVAALVVTVALIGGAAFLLGAPAAVQANDEPLGAMTAPHYRYSQVPPQPIELGRKYADNTPILVEAEVSESGRVFNYQILAGPSDPAVERRIEANLLESVFEPATVFGVPVNGRVMVTYTGVSVHG